MLASASQRRHYFEKTFTKRRLSLDAVTHFYVQSHQSPLLFAAAQHLLFSSSTLRFVDSSDKITSWRGPWPCSGRFVVPTFWVNWIHHMELGRRDVIDFAQMVSSLVSIAFVPVNSNALWAGAALLLQQIWAFRFQVSVADVSESASACGNECVGGAHVSLLYRTCASSALSTSNNELNVWRYPYRWNMIWEGCVFRSWLVTVHCHLRRENQRLSRGANWSNYWWLLVLGLILGELTIFPNIPDNFLETQEHATSLPRQLRVLLAHLRTPSLTGAFRRPLI